MKQSIEFMYNGIHSDEMGVYMISNGAGLFEESLLPETEFREYNTAFRKGIKTKKQKRNLVFQFNIFLEKWRTMDNLREVFDWLEQDNYYPLSFDSHPNKVIYAQLSKLDLIHNGAKDGYLQAEFITNSPYIYSPELEENITVNDELEKIIFNEGDLDSFPIFHFKMNTAGSISIHDGEKEFVIDNLNKDEELWINTELKTIKSNLEELLNIYRYKYHNDHWIKLKKGGNNWIFKGDFELQIKRQNIYNIWF